MRHRGDRPPGLIPRIGLLLALALLLTTAAAPVAAAEGGLVVLAQARYQVQPAEHRVRVTIDAVATSFEPNTAEGQIYYSGISFAVPAGASNVAASAGGQSIGARIEETNDDFTTIEVTFGRGVFFRQSYRYTVSFDLVDPGGAGTRDLRIGRSLVAFPVWAFGTQGEPGSSVRVELPASYTADQQGSEMAEAELPGGGTLLTAEPDDPSGFFAYISADRPGAFANRNLQIDVNGTSAQVLIRPWEDDPAWGKRLISLMRRGLPALQELIGIEYPVSGRLSVEEAAVSRLGEYAGIYNSVTGVIRVRYDADAIVALHEAAHIWFNGDLFRDRWINEAWAEFYAVEAGRLIDEQGAIIELTDELLAVRIPLNEWGAIGVESLQVEDFAYAATYSLAQDIAERTDLDALRLVWLAADEAEQSYQPAHRADDPERGVPFDLEDWKRLLDLLENRTGVEYVDLWEEWVVNDDQLPLLAERDAARSEHEDTIATAGDWELPSAIRAELGAWEFDDAQEALADAAMVLAERDRIVGLAAALELDPPDTLRQAFEGDEGLDDAVAEAAAEIEALGLLAAAAEMLEAEPGLLESIGMVGSDPQADLAAARGSFEGGELEASREAAARATAARDGADDAGRTRVAVAGGGVLLLDGLGLAYAFARRRRRLALHTA
jgi:hypothetical protein